MSNLPTDNYQFYLASDPDLNKQETTSNNPYPSISHNLQDKIIDQVLLQAGGVGLGVIISIVGALLLANWMGVKPAIQEWVNKQKVESETLKTISDTLAELLRDSQLHNNRCAEENAKIINTLGSVDNKVDGLREDIRYLTRDMRDRSASPSNSTRYVDNIHPRTIRNKMEESQEFPDR